MSGAIFVVLPPTASELCSLVLDSGGIPVIDTTGGLPSGTVPKGAWVRIRPGRPAPGTGPVILAEFGAPVPDRDTWLESAVPREIPPGFVGLVLKGSESGGVCGEEDGLSLLARCPQPGKVILDAGVGPHTAGSAAAMGAAGVLLVEQHLGCPELSLSASMKKRLGLTDDEVSSRVSGVRAANAATSPVLRRLSQGEDPWTLADGLWTSGDLRTHVWLAGQGLALARELGSRYGTLQALIHAYITAWKQWPIRSQNANAVVSRHPCSTAKSLLQPNAAAAANGIVGSGVLWQEALWQGIPVLGGPLIAAIATGGDIVVDPQTLEQTRKELLKDVVLPDTAKTTQKANGTPAPAPKPVAAAEEDSTAMPAIAIIGMGCRMPGANSLSQFWSNIESGVSAIEEVPNDRWAPELYFDADPSVPDKSYTVIGGFLKDFTFNSKRFRIPPKVARQVDPVQQITLESVADALEDADLKVDKKSNGREFDRERCAVILGNSLGGEVKDQYALRVGWPKIADNIVKSEGWSELPESMKTRFLTNLEREYKADLPEINEDSMPGELSNVIAGRIANAFDLRGANFTVDAACASSMAAVQAAVKGLQSRDFDIAITGGSDRSMNIATYVKFCKIGALSPDHSSPFDASANGFVMGEGCGIMIMKRFEDAVADGDKIYAVVRGIGASSDGKGKGITAPNIKGQLLALERAYEMAGFAPQEVDLFECHGTSTVVGDKVELEAITQVIGAGKRGERGPIRVGSVKSMIGHLKSAAGAAAIIKSAKALYHGTLPPSLGFKQARPDVPMDTVPLQVQTRAEPWPETPSGLRRCGVSAFGFGGTNFHVVMESFAGQAMPHTPQIGPTAPQLAPTAKAVPSAASAPVQAPIRVQPKPISKELPTGLWATSAMDREGLLANLQAILDGKPVPFNPSDPLRIAAASKDAKERKAQIERSLKVVTKGSNPELLRARSIYLEDSPMDGRLCMVFTGQGSQYLDMGLDLMEEYPIVAETFKEADEILTPILGKPITEFIRLNPGEDAKAKELTLRQTEYSQPATLTLDVAILRLLASFGVYPEIVAGHSLGEYGAAVAAGIMSFEQALRAVSARGREMANIKIDDPGKMAGIATSAIVVNEVLAEVGGYVIAANKNCSSQTVIAGASDAVDEATERFRARGITVYPLPVSHAFHSSIVAPASKPLRAVLGRLGLRAPQRPITTNVTAEYYPTGDGAVDVVIDTLAKQVAAPVEWTAQVERMYDDGARVFVECGPKRALSGFIVSILKRKPHRALYTNHPKRGGVWSFRDALAGLLVTGFPVQTECRPGMPNLMATSEPRKATTEAITANMALHEEATEAIPDITEGILRIVAAKTGYDTRDLDLSFELEADMGIDTVKQAEVFAVVRDTYGIAPDPDFVFGQHKTLRSVIDWAASRLGATRPSLPESRRTQTAPVVSSPPQNPLVGDNVISKFLADAATAGMSEADGTAFANALLPAVQTLLKTAFDASRQSTPAPAAVAPAAALPAPPVPPVVHPVQTTSSTTNRGMPEVVCTGASLGLPGGEEVFGPDNVGSLFRGENRISHIGDRVKSFMELELVRLVKDPTTGQGEFLPVTKEDQVLRLAGLQSKFAPEEFGIPENLVRAFDTTTRLAIAATIEALRDAGIPLVRTFKTSASGKQVPQGWELPESMRDDTGVVFGSCFPGYDSLVRHAQNNGDDGSGHFDRRFLFQILAMGHSQVAQFIGARGPNTQCNAACASTAQAVAIAQDWLRVGRCRRVIVVGADNVTSPDLLKWIGGGFMAAGAASTHDIIEETALPFDARRHGLILGMGAASLILETREACAERGVKPLATLLDATIVNSAFHGTRLNPQHIAQAVQKAVNNACAQENIQPSAMAEQALFMSHETFTPARGGSAQAEVEALRGAFGNQVAKISVTNTKGFTGHPMGAGIEDTMAVKSLQYDIAPPIANLKEPDESLGTLRFSQGERRPFRYALRLAAGFGSQLAFLIWRAEVKGDDRVADPALRSAWLKKVTGFKNLEEFVEKRTLRVRAAEIDVLLPLIPESSPLRTVPALTETSPTETPSQPVQAPTPTAPPQATVSVDKIQNELLDVIAAKTGYDVEELELDFELEADLGIDTVKQAEIFADFRDKYGLERDDSFSFADYNTIEKLAAYLANAISSGGDTPPAGPAPEPQTAPETVTETPAPPAPVAETAPAAVAQESAVPAPSSESMLSELIALISVKTGYEPDELEPDFELEADLGIDTVKQAEIFSELREKYQLERDDSFSFADYPTIETLAGYLQAAAANQGSASAEPSSSADAPPTPSAPVEAPSETSPPAEDVAPAEAPADLAGGDTMQDLLAVIAEKTGYETDELEVDFELEADLGIDTVKQAEIFAELREKYGLERDDNFNFADYPTIEDLVGYLNTRRALGASADASSAPATTEAAPDAPEPVVEQAAVAAPPAEEAPTADTPPNPVPESEEDDSLPDSFRIRRPILVGRPANRGKSVKGLRIKIIGEGALAEIVRATLESKGALFQAPFDTVLDVGAQVMESFHTAQEMQAAQPNRWLGVTRLGGFDRPQEPEKAQQYGAIAGFTKALGREWEKTQSTVLDVDSNWDDQKTAEIIVEELGYAESASELFRIGTRREAVAYQTETVPARMALKKGAVVMVTGGGRGICARISKEIARRQQATLILIGRSPPGEKLLDLDQAKKRIKEELRNSSKRVRPVDVEKALQPLRKSNEVLETIESLRALGATVEYRTLDMADATAVKKLVEELTTAHGSLDYIIHGAGVEESRQLGDKDDNAFRRVFDGKAHGGLALVQAAPEDTMFVSMGSVAGRFGNPGQVDYSAANDALARICLSRPLSLHIDWTAWDNVGMAVRGGMRRLLEDRGVDLLPAPAGANLLVNLMANGASGELIVAGGLGDFYPAPSHNLLDSMEIEGDCVRVSRTLSLKSDGWITDHSINNVPVLPGVVGLELMGAVATLASPGKAYAGARNVSFKQPIKLHKGQPVLLVAEARHIDKGLIGCTLSSERTLRTGRTQRVEHFTAEIILGIAPEVEPLPTACFPDESLRKESIYERFFHGPIFQVIRGVHGIAGDALLAEGHVHHTKIATGLITQPLVLEAAFQAAGLHHMLVAHEMGLPSHIEEVQLIQDCEEGATLTITVNHRNALYDVDVDSERGPILRLRGFKMAVLGPLPPDKRFPEPDDARPMSLPQTPLTTAPGNTASASASWQDDPDLWMTEAEQHTLTQRGTKRRVRDRLAGRIAAKRAIQQLTGIGPENVQVKSLVSGAPIIIGEHTDDVRVSISHRNGKAIAMATKDAHVGVDLECIEPRGPVFENEWFTRAERAVIAGRPSHLTISWSAKEAVLKALGKGFAYSPHDVEILDINSEEVQVRLKGDAAKEHVRLGGQPIHVHWQLWSPNEVIVEAKFLAA